MITPDRISPHAQNAWLQQGARCVVAAIAVIPAIVLTLTGLFLSAIATAAPLSISLSLSPLSLPFFVAENQGFYAAEGLAVRSAEVLGGHRAMQDMLAGKTDLATCSEAVVMFTSFKRDDLAVLATFGTSLEDVKIVTLDSNKILRARDLGGRRVGTIAGAASHYYLDMLALLDGVAPESISVVGMEPEAMAGALMQGDIDAIAVWQPYAYRAGRNIPGARVLQDDGFYTLSFNLVSIRSTVAPRRDDIVKLLRALDKAQRFILTNPGKAREILRARLGIDQAYADWIWPRYHYQLRLDQSLLTTLESEARWALAGGHVQGTHPPNYLRLIQAGPLRSVNPSAVGIVD